VVDGEPQCDVERARRLIVCQHLQADLPHPSGGGPRTGPLGQRSPDPPPPGGLSDVQTRDQRGVVDSGDVDAAPVRCQGAGAVVLRWIRTSRAGAE